MESSYHGKTELVSIPGSIAAIRRGVISIEKVTGNNYNVTLFNDTTFDQVRGGIISRYLPPFWFAVLGVEVLFGTRNILQINPIYLRETTQNFDDLVNIFKSLSNGTTLQYLNDDKHILTITLTVQGSVTERIIQALREQKPKELTEEQIEHICNQIPPLPYPDASIAALQLQEIQQHLREQLMGVKLTPLAFDKYARTMRQYYLRSLLQPQEQVGIATTDSITAPAMQNALNARHKFGTSAGMSATIELFEQVLLNQQIKTTEMIIFFENRHITEDDIIASKYIFEQITIDDLIIEATLEGRIAVQQWWWDPYVELKGIQIPADAAICLQVKIDMEIMFDHQISMTDIVTLITHYSNAIRVIPSPVLLEDGAEIDDEVNLVNVKRPVAYLHIFCLKSLARDELKRKNIEASDDMIELAFLRQAALPELRNRLVSGIPDVLEIEPRHYELMPEDKDASNSYIISATALSDPNQWELFCDKYLLRKSCLTLNDIIYLIQAIELQNQRITNITVPYEIVTTVAGTEQARLSRDRIQLTFVPNKPDETPFTFIKDTIKEEAKKWKANQIAERNKRGNPYFSLPITPLLAANRIYFARALGSNLRKVCLLDIVDPNFTYCNNPNEVMDVFGIEVAMVVIMKILLDVLENTSVYIDLLYVKLATEFKCNQGIILSLGHYGADKQPNETLAKATASRAIPVITKTASMGRLEESHSVSSAVLTATLANFGAGAIKVVPRGVAAPKLQIRTGGTVKISEPEEEEDMIQGNIGSAPSVPLGQIPSVLQYSAVTVSSPPETSGKTLLTPKYQNASQYTLAAAADVRIPISRPKEPALKATNIVEVELPNFTYLNLSYPPWLIQLFEKVIVISTIPAVPKPTGTIKPPAVQILKPVPPSSNVSAPPAPKQLKGVLSLFKPKP